MENDETLRNILFVITTIYMDTSTNLKLKSRIND